MSHYIVRRGVLNPPAINPLPYASEEPELRVIFPQSYAPLIIAALEYYTQYAVYDGSDYDAQNDTITRIHAIIQSIEENMIDCAEIEDCLDGSTIIQSIRTQSQNTQNAAEAQASATAVSRYTASGSNAQAYNPATPARYSTGSQSSDKILCIIAYAYAAEFARKLYNYSETMLGLSNFVLGFGGLIANLNQYMPSWLGSILNYVVLPLVGVTYNEYLEIKSASQDAQAINSLACQLSENLYGMPPTYAIFQSAIAAIDDTSGTDNENELAYRAKLWLANEPAFLYWIDLIAAGQSIDTSQYEDCICPPAETLDYNFALTKDELDWVNFTGAFFDYASGQWGTNASSLSSYQVGFQKVFTEPQNLRMCSVRVWGGSTAGQTLTVQYLDANLNNLSAYTTPVLPIGWSIQNVPVIANNVSRVRIWRQNNAGGQRQFEVERVLFGGIIT